MDLVEKYSELYPILSLFLVFSVEFHSVILYTIFLNKYSGQMFFLQKVGDFFALLCDVSAQANEEATRMRRG